MNIYFVILHYQVIDETIKCIDSIMEMYDLMNPKLVIVDNCSPNASGKALEKKYKNTKQVIVILNDKNMGFASGNNVGYRYSKENGADFIIQVNNDTIFYDKKFIDVLIRLYEEEKYAVLGPDIICMKDGEHQNPLPGFRVNRKNIVWKIFKNLTAYILSFFNLDIVLKNNKVYQPVWDLSCDISQSEQFVLQGCCYIFSPIYIQSFDGMFDGTFMYYEEYILDYLCRKDGLKIYYSPKLSLKHKRKAATSSGIQNDRRKRRFKYIESFKSLSAFYRLINKRE